MKDAQARARRDVERATTEVGSLLPRARRTRSTQLEPKYMDSMKRVATLSKGCFVTTCYSGPLRVYDASGQVLHSLDFHDGATDVATLGGDLFASVCYQGKLATWNGASGKHVDSFALDKGFCSLVAVSYNTIAVGTDSGSICWVTHNQGRNLTVQYRTPVARHERITRLAVQGSTLAGIVSNGTVVLWDVNTHERIGRIQGMGSWQKSLDINERFLVVVCGDKVRIYDNEPGFKLRTVVCGLHSLSGIPEVINDVLLVGDDHMLTVGAEKSVIFTNIDIVKPMARFQSHVSDANTFALVPNGKILVGGQEAHLISIPCRGVHLRLLHRYIRNMYGIALSSHQHQQDDNLLSYNRNSVTVLALTLLAIVCASKRIQS